MLLFQQGFDWHLEEWTDLLLLILQQRRMTHDLVPELDRPVVHSFYKRSPLLAVVTLDPGIEVKNGPFRKTNLIMIPGSPAALPDTLNRENVDVAAIQRPMRSSTRLIAKPSIQHPSPPMRLRPQMLGIKPRDVVLGVTVVTEYLPVIPSHLPLT